MVNFMASYLHGMARSAKRLCVCVSRVGAALLRAEYEQAVRLILQPREGDREEAVDARRLYLDNGKTGHAWYTPSSK